MAICIFINKIKKWSYIFCMYVRGKNLANQGPRRSYFEDRLGVKVLQKDSFRLGLNLH